MLEVVQKNGRFVTNNSFENGFEADELLFAGMRTMAVGKLPNSKTKQYHTIPIGHTADYPVSFNETGKNISFPEESRLWLANPLIEAICHSQAIEADISVQRNYEAREVIILNCLDSCYGHALDKLFNAQRHLEHSPEIGLIMIVHPSMNCLIPNGVAETWVVNASFSDFEKRIKGFDHFVKSKIATYEKVFLSKASMHLDYSQLRIQDFVKKKPFAFEKLGSKPITVTLILREDRFWLRSKFSKLLYFICIKYKIIRYLNWVFSALQNRNVRSLAYELKKYIKGVQISAYGIGTPGKLSSSIIDLRENYTDYRTHEEERYAAYAISQMVIGIHGSSMILPTALAGSFISLLPEHKIAHFSEDYIPRYANSQRQTFLGRFLPDTQSPKLIAKHAFEMLGKKWHGIKEDVS